MADSNISNWRIIIFIIFLNAVYNNSIPLDTNCVTTVPSDVKQMVGVWDLHAWIYPQNFTITCGRLELHQVSTHRLMGHAILKSGGETHQASVQAFVANDILAMRYVWNDTVSREELFAIRTCDTDDEISMELPQQQWYLIFGKTTTNATTQHIMDHYQQLAKSIGLQLRFVHGKECEFPPRK